MFGKLFKKLKDSAEELVENVQQATSQDENTSTNTTETNDVPEVRYYTVDTYSDVEDYLEIIVAIDAQMIGNENQFEYGLDKKNLAVMNHAIDKWLLDIEKYKDQVRQLGPFDGNDFMLNATLKSLDNKKKWVANYYPKYAEAVAKNADNMDEIWDEKEELRTENYNWFEDQFETFRAIFESKVNDQLIDINFIEHDIATQVNAKDNPLLEPIHGITLYDYAAGSSQMGSGISENDILKVLGVEKPQWDEASLIWQQRMQEDDEMTVMTLYSQYFGQIDQHPKLGTLAKAPSINPNNPNLERIKTDEKFFYELVGAREAAMECGMDGAQWMADNYGLEITEFQSQAMIWMRSGNMASMLDYQMKKKEEYLAKFQKETGGTIADDIEF